MDSYQNVDDCTISHQHIEYKQVLSNLVPFEQSKITLMHDTYMTKYVRIFDSNKFKHLYLRDDIDNGCLMREWQKICLPCRQNYTRWVTGKAASIFLVCLEIPTVLTQLQVSHQVVIQMSCTSYQKKQWYNKDILFLQQIIHTMPYGMYCDGMNV